MAQAKSGDKVQVQYVGKLNDGSKFDETSQEKPLEFTIGDGQIIEGFEEAIVGMEEGEEKSVTIPVDKAYGERRPDLVLKVEKERLPENLDPQVGEQLQIPQNEGNPVVVTVTEVTDNDITIDANHPLAGQDLTFDLKLVGVDS
jgi:FKBP-type peptidyl-prolyl cis-trans isomerase 2